jgi:RNA polymerase sigma-B factor
MTTSLAMFRSTQHGDTARAAGRPRKRKSRGPSEAEVNAMFARLRETHDPATRDALVLAHQHLASYFARRFRDRGEPLEDLVQVAQIGLINAVDRYDPTRGVRFGTYAAATIIGELRRYFRDKVWTIHIPRRHRELNYRLMQAVEVLRQTLGRSPTIEELARHTGIPFDVAIEALEASHAYAPVSLDEDPADRAQEDSMQRLEQLGADDPGIVRTDDVLALERAWAHLSDRERAVLALRFKEGLPQSQVAERVQVSQMQVSRIQRRALLRLRALMNE